MATLRSALRSTTDNETVVFIEEDNGLIQLRFIIGYVSTFEESVELLISECSLKDAMLSGVICILAEGAEEVTRFALMTMIKQKLMESGWTDTISIIDMIRSFEHTMAEYDYAIAENADRIRYHTDTTYGKFHVSDSTRYPVMVRVVDDGYNSDNLWCVKAEVFDDYPRALMGGISVTMEFKNEEDI